MVQTTSQLWRKFRLWLLVGIMMGGASLYSASSGLEAAAQSTGDTLLTATFTRQPSTGTSSSPSAERVWQGRLVSNTLGVTKGQGSIFRVSVEGLMDTPIELRSDDQLIMARSGSKPEYGTYAAEFAPVTKGVWTVTVPAIDAAIEVEADNYNLAVIEFVQVEPPEATPIGQPPATATPLGGISWTGRLVSENNAGGTPFSRLLVRVVGRDNQAVRLSTLSQLINTANTGQKPEELGPNVVEFTGLTPGYYIVELPGLNASLEVTLKPNIETLVEFTPQEAPPVTATSSDLPVLTLTSLPATPTPTSTVEPTATATLTPSLTPLPLLPSVTPTPVTRWVGVIDARSMLEPAEPGQIVVRVAGIEGLPVRLSGDNLSERRCVTGQGQWGPDRCAFEALTPGRYLVSPEGIGSALPVTLLEHEAVQVGFEVEKLPVGVAGWRSQLLKNSSGSQALQKTESVIQTRLLGRQGQLVALHSARGIERFCDVTPDPVLEVPACEFRELGPGVYTVEAVNTGARMQVFVDGEGQVEVEFSPTASSEFLALKQVAPIVGWGGRPQQATVLPTSTPVPVVLTEPTATFTPSPTLTPTMTATPAPAWRGHIIESKPFGGGVIGVRVLGLKDHPVILRSGTWQSSPLLTGAKPELGNYAVEFGGLAPGRYLIDLVDLAQLEVELPLGHFILVEFREE